MPVVNCYLSQPHSGENSVLPAIRFVAICVFRNGSRILVARGIDKVTQEAFLRPLGGAVEFGERSVDAIRREIREELDAEINDPTRIGMIENVFSYEGQVGHEIVIVFDAQFADRDLYNRECIPIHEEQVWDGPALWIDLSAELPLALYPDGLMELLSQQSP